MSEFKCVGKSFRDLDSSDSHGSFCRTQFCIKVKKSKLLDDGTFQRKENTNDLFDSVVIGQSVPTLTYGHELQAVTERMRWWEAK